ncbi:MAG: Choline oxidase, partial [uncultured Rubrobacteraceae bacterium]
EPYGRIRLPRPRWRHGGGGGGLPPRRGPGHERVPGGGRAVRRGRLADTRALELGQSARHGARLRLLDRAAGARKRPDPAQPRKDARRLQLAQLGHRLPHPRRGPEDLGAGRCCGVGARVRASLLRQALRPRQHRDGLARQHLQRGLRRGGPAGGLPAHPLQRRRAQGGGGVAPAQRARGHPPVELRGLPPPHRRAAAEPHAPDGHQGAPHPARRPRRRGGSRDRPGHHLRPSRGSRLLRRLRHAEAPDALRDRPGRPPVRRRRSEPGRPARGRGAPPGPPRRCGDVGGDEAGARDVAPGLGGGALRPHRPRRRGAGRDVPLRHQ